MAAVGIFLLVFPKALLRLSNDNGIIVGSFSFDPLNTTGAYYINNGIPYELPGFTTSGGWNTAHGVNNYKEIVGSSSISENEQRAFLWIQDSGAAEGEGTIINLNDLIAPYSGWTLTHAEKINDNGVILGSGKFASPGIVDRSFVLVYDPRFSGDLDGDNDVDGVDLANFARDYNAVSPNTDLNNDWWLNSQDIAEFANNFGL
ncbi:MAG: hypothetical protein KQH63_14770 [Desulfobulbaceae bacterium]|nr:hypothetical protein [Desulfobulbaceae bacterium]